MSGAIEEKKASSEAHAYTPGLKVKRATKVNKMRRLPILGEVLVKVGDTVEHDTIVARTEISGEPKILKAAAKLGVETEDLNRYMIRKLGDTVKEGEIIAYNSSFFGLIKRDIVAPFDGTIASISELTGQVIIRGNPIPVNIDAYIPGKVIEVMTEL